MCILDLYNRPQNIFEVLKGINLKKKTQLNIIIKHFFDRISNSALLSGTAFCLLNTVYYISIVASIRLNFVL